MTDPSASPDSVTVRRGLLLAAYQLEREDERAFWTNTSALMLSASSIILAVTALSPPRAWQVWVVTPGVVALMFAYHVHQAALGTRRRRYLEALERDLCGTDDGGGYTIAVEGHQVRLLAYNRYSLSLNRKHVADGVGYPGAALFLLINFIPAVLALAVLVSAVARLWVPHRTASIATAVVGLLADGAVFALLVVISGRRGASWEFSDPNYRPAGYEVT